MRMKHYRQLAQEERYQIAALKDSGLSNAEIARRLSRSASTISRELMRNRGVKGYQAATAQRLSDKRRRTAYKADKRIPELIAWVTDRLQDKWSPEQIAGSAKAAGFDVISHEWIYQLVLRDKAAGGKLAEHLRHRQRRYRRRYGVQDRRGKIPNRVGIDERPAVVDERSRYGDWEGDSIVGKGSAALVTLLERKSGYVFIRKVARSTAALTCEAMVSMLSLVDRRQTVTLDNGSEFSHHEQVSAALDCQIYFARPYHSWERGANENVNGLIRQYFPKGTDFDGVADEQIQAVEQAINLRPRKRLGYKAPIEFIDQLIDFSGGCAVNA
jgi:transposase, IS30 family